jgi:hypothetical protein
VDTDVSKDGASDQKIPASFSANPHPTYLSFWQPPATLLSFSQPNFQALLLSIVLGATEWSMQLSKSSQADRLPLSSIPLAWKVVGGGEVAGVEGGEVADVEGGEVAGAKDGEIAGAKDGEVAGAKDGEIADVEDGEVAGAMDGKVSELADGEVAGDEDGKNVEGN